MAQWGEGLENIHSYDSPAGYHHCDWQSQTIQLTGCA